MKSPNAYRNSATGYLGVSPSGRKSNPFKATVFLNKGRISLGNHATAYEAALARDAYIIEHHLPCKLSFPEEWNLGETK